LKGLPRITAVFRRYCGAIVPNGDSVEEITERDAVERRFCPPRLSAAFPLVAAVDCPRHIAAAARNPTMVFVNEVD
jgi:hypothetical protein